jgi:anti-sigma factor RsiW
MRPPLTPQDWETLSTYLDGQLTETDKRQIQDLIALRPELKQGLEELRRTRAVLRAAPRRRAPRNFTLSAEMAKKARPRFRWGWTPSFSFASAMAALLLVLSFFFRVNLAQLTFFSPMAAQAPLAASQENATSSGNPPIIVWNSPGQAMGLGGAPAGAVPGAGGGNGLESTEIASIPPQADSQTMPQTTTPEPGVYPSPEQQPGLAAPATSEPSAEPKLAAPVAPQPTIEAATAQDSSQSGPILGIAPTEEQGRMFVPAQATSNPAQSTPVDRWIYVQIGLAGIALVFALAAFFAWRKAHH